MIMDLRTTRDELFARLRKKEFARLDENGHTYLDYTGGNIYPQSLVDAHGDFLSRGVYGNPHSRNPASIVSEEFVKEARDRVLHFFQAHDYYCIFTANATGALKIVGECYPFSSNAHLLLTTDNHNSVNGIREYCKNRGGAYTYSPMNRKTLTINEAELSRHLQNHPDKNEKLFAFPAQSNVSGIQHSLEWISKAHEENWDVLLDAAAFVPTSALDLTIHSPDFVSLSFYKMFGYPTGIGCLLVKKAKFHKLKKSWYAGGTITLSAVGHCDFFLKHDHEQFEDGTINYLNIPAITNGLNFIASIGMENINRRIKELSRYLLSELSTLYHANGSKLIKLYGPRHVENRGGTFMMNFFDVNEQCYSPQRIEQLGSVEKISFRTGCFCNPGVDELNHDISPDTLRNYFDGRHRGDYDDFVAFTGKTRGAVRISMGIPTTKSDVDRFIGFARTFLDKTIFQLARQ